MTVSDPFTSFVRAAVPEICAWQPAMEHIAKTLAQTDISPADAIVLLPYLQLVEPARQAWAKQGLLAASRRINSVGAAFYIPRFETTQSWADRLGGAYGLFEAQGSDLRLDRAFDRLTAASLLTQVGMPGQSGAIINRLVEAAWSLAWVAASIAPDQRLAWGDKTAQELVLGLDAPVLELEAAISRIALAWAATSAYATDRLFAVRPAFFAVLEGFQNEPLAQALKAHCAQHIPVLSISLLPQSLPSPDLYPPAFHPAGDAEDEAGRAAACVLRHLAEGRQPVALIAQDRLLTRRIGALLAHSGLAVRDETGWTLSTTRAAASLMGLLRAMAWNASADAVLDWLKNAPAFDNRSVAAAESAMRQRGLRQWRDLPVTPASPAVFGTPTKAPAATVERASVAAIARAALAALQAPVEALRCKLRTARPLAQWLAALRIALQQTGQWQPLETDPAGQKVLQVLRLQAGDEAEFKDVPALQAAMPLGEFTQWVSQTLEGETFSPASGPGRPQVLILPLPQLLGRSVAAVVFPGCDEIRLPVSPEPLGGWSRAQRLLLGLPSRAALAASLQRAWSYALAHPQVDLLWRTQQAGEAIMPSGLVRSLLLELRLQGQGQPPGATDPRVDRRIQARPTQRPAPIGQALPIAQLSASAYSDLRNCPYRFHATHQLRLKAPDELDSELDKRDFGNWLHYLLRLFHEALKVAPAHGIPARAAIINIAAEEARVALYLSAAEFLPYAAAWPAVRDGYLAWLEKHEAGGAVFEQAEVRYSIALAVPPTAESASTPGQETAWSQILLTGVLDRIDRQANGQWLLLDYKTEAIDKTKERIKNPSEDTQLAFYAALTANDAPAGDAPAGSVAAGYLNLGEKDGSTLHSHSDMQSLRDDLCTGIAHDLGRIASGAVLPALGSGTVCETCAARGLCRRDFWAD